ncbi:hypothetical protein [Szabonella alba]|nr:hypothetical protein [Szabonella alba]
MSNTASNTAQTLIQRARQNRLAALAARQAAGNSGCDAQCNASAA